MARFKPGERSQGLFLEVNLYDQLVPGTFEWTLDYLIDRMDLSLYEQNYNNDEMGAAAYHPKALLKAVLHCYSLGILSSRKIEYACKSNIMTKALADGAEPDHATIAQFISGNCEAVQDLFVQVVLRCDELDLITGEMFAYDGCKLPSNASKEWSGTIEMLKKKKARLEKFAEKLLKRHKELDKSDEAKKKQKPYTKTMGDDRERRERHRARVEKKLKRLEEFLKYAKPKVGVSGAEVQTNVTDPQSAKIKGPHGYIQGYNGIAVADSGNQVILCAKAVGSGPESGAFPQMLDRLETTMQAVTGKEKPLQRTLSLADTGFFSEENLQEAAQRGIEVLIPDPQFRQRDEEFEGRKQEKKKYSVEDFEYNKKDDSYICPAGKTLVSKGTIKLRNNEGKKYQAGAKDCGQCPCADMCISKRKENVSKRSQRARTLYIVERKYEENLSEKMKEKIDDPAYRELYSRRQQIVEPVFADITYCKRMNRFMLRGEEKVDAQWQLYSIVHNIAKCIRPLSEKFINKIKRKKKSGQSRAA
ncbi:MAG: IS1182 family transposase [Leptospirales bacterium]|nr:IS1182 family transposase [Leptospirales bacterium]